VSTSGWGSGLVGIECANAQNSYCELLGGVSGDESWRYCTKVGGIITPSDMAMKERRIQAFENKQRCWRRHGMRPSFQLLRAAWRLEIPGHAHQPFGFGAAGARSAGQIAMEVFDVLWPWPLIFSFKNWHSAYSCPEERLCQFRFFYVFCFSIRSRYGSDRRMDRKTDRQTDRRMDGWAKRVMLRIGQSDSEDAQRASDMLSQSKRSTDRSLRSTFRFLVMSY